MLEKNIFNVEVNRIKKVDLNKFVLILFAFVVFD